MEHSGHPGGVPGRYAAAPVPPFLRLNFVTLWVRDQERSRRFFMEKLDFEVIVDAQTPEGGRWIVVAPPAAGWLTGTTGAGLTGMALVVPPKGSTEHQRIGQNTGLSFLTEDVRSLFAEWSRRGVRFPLAPMEPEWGAGQARYALFEDVDGNSFSLIEFDEATRTLEAERRAQVARLEAERQAAHDLAIAKQVQTRLFPQRQPPIRTLAYAGICKSSNRWLALRKQTGLHLLGDCQVVRGLALRFQPGGLVAALCFQRARRLIELNQRETVSVHILKECVTCLASSPFGFHRCERETDSASRPFCEQATHVFGKKAESGVLADALVLCGSFGWDNEGHPSKTRACGSSEPTSSWRSDNDPPAALGSLRVHNHLEI